MRRSGLLDKGSELLVKHRSLVIGLVLVSLGGVGLLVHLGIILNTKKPHRPSPAPSPAVQVKVSVPRPNPEAVSPPDSPRRPAPSKPLSASSHTRPQAVHPVDVRSEPSAVETGQVVPVIVERRRSAVMIIRDNPAKPQGEHGVPSGESVQSVDNRSAPRKDSPAEPAAESMPFFAPPAPPEGGINALIESTPQPNMKQALSAYIRTYYPLIMLDAESVKLLDAQGKAEYTRQKAALDKELVDSLRDSMVPTPGGIDSGYPKELIDTFRSYPDDR